jgi:ADP-ribose pyrophosphatase YjhB (NUDIX family)
MSPQRIDYYDSPEAPRANSLVPAVNVVIVNDAGEILLIRRADNSNRAVPGGAVDLGESVAQAAVRETLEESGIECAITGIVGIYSDPRCIIAAQRTHTRSLPKQRVLRTGDKFGHPIPTDKGTVTERSTIAFAT